ncbi:Pycsar system effector family protein [Aureimonas ureilytica]|uniref:Pycsar system effector family protein n=1 Tax=Aureimonas ureilytica TaxID=401562 RepID=UPI003D2ECC24
MSASHVISIILTLIFALVVIFPRFRSGGSAFYWGAWPDAGERLQRQLNSESYSSINEYLDSNIVLAKICRSKFKNLRYSFSLLIFACITHAILLSMG